MASLPGVLGWGLNPRGEVGNGTTDREATPVPTGLPSPASTSVRQIVMGLDTPDAAALMADGTVDTWGLDLFGELGDGTITERHSPRP